ncbi:MAG: class I SAM-dependent methyltransferase [Pseudolabrys sp.]|nr:class I SAM-dependent methyltransferase [Pseudolabrys sp.]
MVKEFVRRVDQALLGGRLSRLNQHLSNVRQERRWRAEAEAGSPYRLVSHYRGNRSDPFWMLCDKYGSDKAESTSLHPTPSVSHSYADFYSRLFAHCRNGVARVFECGLGTNNPDFVSNMGLRGRPGASLRVWRDYFPKAIVIGADIDREVLFSEDRIQTFYIDQLDPAAIASFWQSVGLHNFDLMVDDGLHTFEAGRCLFEHSIGRLAPGGIYIIEDVKLGDLVSFKRYFLDKPYLVDYVNLFRPNVPLSDNNLVVIRRP